MVKVKELACQEGITIGFKTLTFLGISVSICQLTALKQTGKVGGLTRVHNATNVCHWNRTGGHYVL